MIIRGKKTIPSLPEKLWTHPLYFIAFGLGAGATPIAPGTIGTLFAIPFYLLLQSLFSPFFYLLFTCFLIIFSTWICEIVSREMRIHDHPGICIDEFAGFFVTMLYIPYSLSYVILGFILFRLFDILKPWPIRFLDKKITGGFGIVLDDVVAGLYSCACMHILILF